jgi:aldehyde:ferredoxin oxidoreductase
VMSTGVVLAWATEAQQRGLLSQQETDGVPLAWNKTDAYLEAVERIVEQPNELYRCMARGVDCAAERFGGSEFALAFGGNEMPGYHTGPAAHVGFLVGARHSHLDNAGYSIDQKTLVKKKMTPEELAQALLSEEGWRQILSSLVVCFFARGIYQPQTVSNALQLAGVAMTTEELKRMGELIHREKYRFKFREGFSLESMRIPERIFQTPSLVGEWDEQYVRRTLDVVRKRLTSAAE